MKRYAKVVISGLYFGVVLLKRSFDRPAPGSMIVLAYHGVSSQNRLNFERHLNILSRHAHIVPADWCGTPDPIRPTVAITFDDAFISVVENALPALAKRGLPCTLFPPSSVLGRNPDWVINSKDRAEDRAEIVIDAAQLQRVHGPLVVIGAHSASHPLLTRISAERAWAEITGSRDAIANIIRTPVTLFAFPYGDYNEHLIEICRLEGFRHVFTVEAFPFDPRARSFVRGRVVVDPQDRDIELFLKIQGAYAWIPVYSRLKRRFQSTWFNRPIARRR